MTRCSCQPTERGRIANMRLCPEGERLWTAFLGAIGRNDTDLDTRRDAYLAHVRQAAERAREGASNAA